MSNSEKASNEALETKCYQSTGDRILMYPAMSLGAYVVLPAHRCLEFKVDVQL